LNKKKKSLKKTLKYNRFLIKKVYYVHSNTETRSKSVLGLFTRYCGLKCAQSIYTPALWFRHQFDPGALEQATGSSDLFGHSVKECQ